MIRWFESLFETVERIIEAKPLLSSILGGVLAYVIGFGLPLSLSLFFNLKMTDGWMSFALVMALAVFGAFLVVFVHWALARYCQHRLSQILNFLGAMVFPVLMFAVWTQLILFRGMD